MTNGEKLIERISTAEGFAKFVNEILGHDLTACEFCSHENCYCMSHSEWNCIEGVSAWYNAQVEGS